MKCKILLMGLTALLMSCNSGPDFSGLCGEWVIEDESAIQIETWNCSESGARGSGYRIVGADTVFAEKFSLAHFTEQGWVLNVSVQGQNQDAYIPFSLTQWEVGKLEFSNPSHDFPNRITYTWSSSDTLIAIVDDGPSGIKQMEFKYARASEVH